jgi:hypothetical protein
MLMEVGGMKARRREVNECRLEKNMPSHGVMLLNNIKVDRIVEGHIYFMKDCMNLDYDLDEPATTNIKHGRPSHVHLRKSAHNDNALEGDDNGGKGVTRDDR